MILAADCSIAFALHTSSTSSSTSLHDWEDHSLPGFAFIRWLENLSTWNIR